MKTFIISLSIISLFFAFSASAADIYTPLIAPDSPFYFVKQWKESIQTFFTFGAESKAKQYLHLAEIRLAEYQKMLEKGKAEIAEKTLLKYQNQLNRAIQKVEELKTRGRDVKNLTEKIKEAASKHLEILQQNLEKVPEQARSGIENAIENSQKNLERIIEKPTEKSESACKNLCGDDVCQEIVCMAIGCPCPETRDSCPQDCKK